VLKSQSRLWRHLAFVTICLLLLGNNSSATSVTSTFTTQVTIAAACTINSAVALNFGSQGALGANVDQTATLQIQCTNTTNYNIGLDAGTGTGATVAVRKMMSGGNAVNYSLYSDSGRTTVWGNTVGSDTVTAVANGASQSFTLYGRIPAQTTPAPGAYSDMVTVTIMY
jgi:spore coat protein U-like protein